MRMLVLDLGGFNDAGWKLLHWVGEDEHEEKIGESLYLLRVDLMS